MLPVAATVLAANRRRSSAGEDPPPTPPADPPGRRARPGGNPSAPARGRGPAPPSAGTNQPGTIRTSRPLRTEWSSAAGLHPAARASAELNTPSRSFGAGGNDNTSAVSRRRPNSRGDLWTALPPVRLVG